MLDDAAAPADLRAADVSFDTPDKDFKPAQATVNLFLHEVIENRALRDEARVIGPGRQRVHRTAALAAGGLHLPGHRVVRPVRRAQGGRGAPPARVGAAMAQPVPGARRPLPARLPDDPAAAVSRCRRWWRRPRRAGRTASSGAPWACHRGPRSRSPPRSRSSRTTRSRSSRRCRRSGSTSTLGPARGTGRADPRPRPGAGPGGRRHGRRDRSAGDVRGERRVRYSPGSTSARYTLRVQPQRAARRTGRRDVRGRPSAAHGGPRPP